MMFESIGLLQQSRIILETAMRKHVPNAKPQNSKPIPTKKLTTIAMLSALALALSWLESMIPFQPGLPGVKLGLANLVIAFALYRLDSRSALLINVVRILLAGLLFSGPFGTLYSMAGGAASLAGMAGLMVWNRRRSINGRSILFSILGISMAGGVFHNLGQLVIAIVFVSSLNLIYYFPVMILSGIVTGLVNGAIARLLLQKLR